MSFRTNRRTRGKFRVGGREILVHPEYSFGDIVEHQDYGMVRVINYDSFDERIEGRTEDGEIIFFHPREIIDEKTRDAAR